MAAEKPFELLPGLVAGQRPLGKVPPDLGVAVERVEALEVVALEVAQGQPVCLEIMSSPPARRRQRPWRTRRPEYGACSPYFS